MLLLLIFYTGNSQTNLVPNPSFEIYVNCPLASVVNKHPPPPPPWIIFQFSGFTYFNSCANTSLISPYLGVPNNYLGGSNYQQAHTGVGYLGFGTISKRVNGYKQGYQEIQLTDSLITGKKYYCGFYVALSNGCKYATDNLAMLITKTAKTIDTVITPSWVIAGNPQVYNYHNPVIKDTQNWVKISAVFLAQGGEQYITIGNFRPDNETTIDTTINPGGLNWAVYALDDVFVTPLDNYCLQANAGRDTTISTGDSAFIGSYVNGIDSIKWLQNGNVVIDSTKPGFWVKPLANTFYVLQQTVNGCFSADTVWVNVQPLPLKFLKYELRFTNGEQVENRWQTANEINVSHFYVQRSTNGRDFNIIHKEPAKNQALNNYAFIDEAPNEGVNYYRIVSVDKDGKTSFSEVRNIGYRTRNNELRIFPIPAKDVVTVGCRSAKTLRVINSLGQIVQQLNNATEQQIINIKQLSQGLYMVQITKANGTIETTKFIKE